METNVTCWSSQLVGCNETLQGNARARAFTKVQQCNAVVFLRMVNSVVVLVCEHPRTEFTRGPDHREEDTELSTNIWCIHDSAHLHMYSRQCIYVFKQEASTSLYNLHVSLISGQKNIILVPIYDFILRSSSKTIINHIYIYPYRRSQPSGTCIIVQHPR